MEKLVKERDSREVKLKQLVLKAKKEGAEAKAKVSLFGHLPGVLLWENLLC